MLKHLRARRADATLLQKGFTLVELLVVIVILGILAAVVVFAVGGSTDNANVKACLAERSTVESAVESYRAQVDGAAPANVQAMITGSPTVESPKRGMLLLRAPRYWSVDAGVLAREAAGGLAADDPRCQP